MLEFQQKPPILCHISDILGPFDCGRVKSGYLGAVAEVETTFYEHNGSTD